eukprot:2505860-Pleurochrysis_carterae.AAC.4
MRGVKDELWEMSGDRFPARANHVWNQFRYGSHLTCTEALQILDECIRDVRLYKTYRRPRVTCVKVYRQDIAYDHFF